MRSKFLLNIAWTGLFTAGLGLIPARAQVVLIPHGDFENEFEKYLVVTVSFVLLCFAVWRFYRNRNRR